MLTKVGSITQPTSAGSVEITLGWECKGIFFWCNDLTADGDAANATLSFGFANASANRVLSFKKIHNVLDVQETMDDDSCIKAIAADLSVLAEAAVASIDSTKVTVTWSTADAIARKVYYLAIGGADVTSTIGNMVLNTSTGTQDITGLPFTPDIVFAACTAEYVAADPGVTDGHTYFSFGAGISATSRFAVSEFISSAATDTGRAQRTDLFILTHGVAGSGDRLSVDYNGSITNGFQIDIVTNAGVVAAVIPYIAFSGGDWELGTYLTKATTGTDTKTGVAFQPKGLLIASWNAAANTAIENDVRLSFGMATAALERATVGASAIISNNHGANFADGSKVYHYGTDSPTSYFISADFVEFTADGWTLNYAVASATQRQVNYVAMGGAETSGIPTGTATETDTAFAQNIFRFNKLATETDSAFALSRNAKIIATGVATETDEALSRIAIVIYVSDSGTVTLAWDANTEPDLAGYKVYRSLLAGDYGVDDATDVGNVTTWTFYDLTRPATWYFVVTAYDTSTNESGFSNELSVVLGEPASEEIDTALNPAVLKEIAIGSPLETDTAFALEVPLLYKRALETDEAFALVAHKIRATGLATETDEAFALIESAVRFIGSGLELDEAFALTITKIVAIGTAEETDEALALTSTHLLATGTATEQDFAIELGLGVTVIFVPMGRAEEPDAAFALSITKITAVGLATETDAAFALTGTKLLTTGLATETDAAFTLTKVKIRSIGLSTETDTALSLAIPSIKVVFVGRANETDFAFDLPRLLTHTISDFMATEIDSVPILGGFGGLTGIAYRVKKCRQIDSNEVLVSMRR